MPASLIVPGGGEYKRYRVPEANTSGTPQSSESSIVTASILSTSQDPKTSKMPSDDIFSDSSLIFVPQEEEKPRRTVATKKESKVIFGSTDIRYRNSEEKNVYKKKNPQHSPNTNRKSVVKLETPTRDLEPKLDAENTGGCDEKVQSSLQMMIGNTLDEESSHSSWLIPPVVTSARVPTRSQDSDIVAQAIRRHLWESPSQPPIFVTPSLVHLIRREGDMLETAVETLLEQKKIGVR